MFVCLACSGFAQSPCLSSFAVVLSQACDGKGWFTSTTELRLVSPGLNASCLETTTVHFKVRKDTPVDDILVSATRNHPRCNQLGRTRTMPRLRAHQLTWDRPFAEKLSTSLSSFPDVKAIVFGNTFNASVEGVVWPPCVTRLKFGRTFNQDIHRVTWPPLLEDVELTGPFDRTINELEWPNSMRKLTLSSVFNQAIDKVVWPPSLQELTFGMCFNQAIDEAHWPASLQRLRFGHSFNQPVRSVTWPACLQLLVFDFMFDQSVDGVVWPASLTHLSFGRVFNRPIDKVAWPPSLRQLTLGYRFDAALQGLGSWLPHLEALTLLMNPAGYSHSLRHLHWPVALETLTVVEGLPIDETSIDRRVQVTYVQ